MEAEVLSGFGEENFLIVVRLEIKFKIIYCTFNGGLGVSERFYLSEANCAAVALATFTC